MKIMASDGDKDTTECIGMLFNETVLNYSQSGIINKLTFLNSHIFPIKMLLILRAAFLLNQI